MKSLKEIRYLYLVLPHSLYCNEKRILLLFATIIATLIIVLGIGLGISSKNASNYRTGNRSFRLPTNVVPDHYSLEMQPYLIPDFFKFSGKVAIDLHCVEETDEIVLHSKELVLKRYKLIEGDTNDKIEISNVKYDSNMDFVIFSLGQKLKTGKHYTLNISFTGDFSHSMNGFLVYRHQGEHLETHYAAVTSFEPHFARTAFPCFDEPAMKATFNITIVRWKNMTSLSNMPLITYEDKKNNWVADIYNKSVIMSTCYVAMFIGQYASLTKGKVKVWAPEYQLPYLNFASDTAVQILSYYERILGVPYPLDKLDIVLAETFSEGLGMIVIPGQHLHHFEIYPQDYEETTRVSVTIILANRIAEQWFGNLVTQKWWDDNWLTITCIAVLEMEVIHNMTAFDPRIGSVASTFLYTNQVDCNKEKNVTSIAKAVDSVEDLMYEQLYDIMTIYMKGQKIVQMLMHILTKELFWNGFRAFLKDNLYGSVDSDTLWHYLTEAHKSLPFKLDLKTLMKPWIHLKGRPMINVVRDYDKKTATVSQISCRASFSEESKNDLWSIPIMLLTASKKVSMINYWFMSRSTTIGVMPEANEWIFVNDRDIGNYYVNYDLKNWQLLARQLRLDHQEFDSEQRLKLLHDVYVAAEKGNLKADTVCQFYMYLSKEDDLSVFHESGFISMVTEYQQIVQDSTSESDWKDFVNSIFIPILQKLDNTDHISIKIRYYLFQYLCEIGDKICADDGMRMVDSKLLAMPSYYICSAIQHQTDDDWKDFYQAIQKFHSRFPEAYVVCSPDNKKIRSYLRNITNAYNSDTYSMIIKFIISNRKSWSTFFQFLDEDFNVMINKDSFMQLDKNVFSHMKNPKKLDKLITILKKRKDYLESETAELIDKKIKSYVLRRSVSNDILKTIQQWLKQRQKPWEKKKQG